jgi:transcriptional regulator with XRE-family HTH domain
MSFGAYLRHVREEAKLTQGQLAHRCGLSDAYINQIETGRTDPPTHQVCRAVAQALGTDEHEIWKRAFTARLERWLKKEGFKGRSSELLANFFESLTRRE